jgi:hypothetical protein
MSGKNDIRCEYLMKNNRSCTRVAVGEGEKVRKKSCLGESKDLCCYLCGSKKECEISCMFLARRPEIKGEEDGESASPVTSAGISVSSDIMNVIVLEEDERILQSWKGAVEGVQKAVVEKGEYIKRPAVAEVKVKMNGALVLTNKRLIWVASRGILSRSYHVSLEVPLERIRGISEGGSFSKYISVVDAQTEYRFFLYFDLDTDIPPLEQFNSVVRPALQARKKEIETEKRKGRVQVMIEFTAIKDFLAKGGILNLQAVKCPVCGGRLKLPEKGSSITCDHCGNEIYAQDIFDKMKDLIV